MLNLALGQMEKCLTILLAMLALDKVNIFLPYCMFAIYLNDFESYILER